MTTITIDKDRCTRCSICAKVCPIGLIEPADEAHLPQVSQSYAARCVRCGHCEISCPAGALVLDLADGKGHGPRAELATEQAPELAPGPSEISTDLLGRYIKSRRSVRQFASKKVEREKIEQILEIARYAPSGGNSQPVQWLAVYDAKKVQKIAGLTIDWVRHLSEIKDPMSAYTHWLIDAWDRGADPICRNAPHLLIAHIPEKSVSASTDGIIALTHFDIIAPAFGVGTCWGGFVSAAARSWKPLQDELGLPQGRMASYAMMFGYPRYRTCRIPGRNPAQITWRL